ncbi:MAG: M20/M25/M40 family metallo-hydrolase [Holophagales bacterium]|nr:M20/M25/M40 family metallo-hydrolase [Holophagales bacterium]
MRRSGARLTGARAKALAVALLGAALLPGPAAAEGQPSPTAIPVSPAVAWELDVSFIPGTGHLRVAATATLPAGAKPEFLLNAALKVVKSEPAVVEVALGDVSAFFGNNAAATEAPRRVPLKRFRAKGSPATIGLTYEGVVRNDLSAPKEEYQRGFRETPGTIGPEGIYLAGSTFWIPAFGEALVSFRMTAKAPAGWQVVSQGDGTARDAGGTARWDSKGPVDEVYLVGGPLHAWRDRAGEVETLAFLREKDDAIAAKYLAATAQYLEMYRGLIGPYPYGKFALVENFWETGYGMASFTLLGPQVIRFPFILTSSYPHEILHNWWGNSVFVDYAKGNWCEGLTAYLADHLIQEQRGKGEEYRRGTLQKYLSYVRDGRDFPLTEFRGRESAATEAVGYGKALMGFHMVRRHLGDATFRKVLSRFYADLRGRRATFDDFRRTAEAVSGTPLAGLFDPWVTRAGAAELALGPATTARAGAGWTVTGTLRQAQQDAPFALEVPVAVVTATGTVRQVVKLDGREASFEVRTDAEPLGLAADPQFDVFRKLDPREIPPSIGQLFGEPKVLAVLPSGLANEEEAAWRALLKGWETPTHGIEVKRDAEVEAFPADRAVWVVGKGNRHASLFGEQEGLTLDASDLTALGEKTALAGHTFVFVARHPGNAAKAVGWLFGDPPAALPGLGRKLPHYGKYSYVGFDGTEPVNVLKGQWPESDSPLRADLRPAQKRGAAMPAFAPETRRALAELPPAFSQARLAAHVAALAAPGLEGRGLGTPGERAAAEYVAAQMKAAGLSPAGDDGGFLQRFRVERTAAGGPADVVNVAGLLPGTDPAWKDQSVVVVAHFDHLGRGWPDARKGSEGQVHPGADDNASGVAVLLELARAMKDEKPKRNVVFLSVTGEEAGRLGSKRWVAGPSPFPAARTLAAVNLDTVGRLGTGKLQVLGTGTAGEWIHAVRGATWVTGVETKAVPETLESSDHVSFVEAGIPAVQLFTGPHADYHRPSDSAEKIDVAGLAKVATVTKELVSWLAGRAEPLTVSIAPKTAPGAPASPAVPVAGSPVPAGSAAPPARRVSFGTMPDFSFEGPGVKVEGVVPGSPAEKAGVKPGDVVLKLDGRDVASLRDFSEQLKGMTPGQIVKTTLRREGKDLEVPVTLVER